MGYNQKIEKKNRGEGGKLGNKGGKTKDRGGLIDSQTETDSEKDRARRQRQAERRLNSSFDPFGQISVCLKQ